jgi:uncharacterized repeat protein (TIGR01451 family)
MEGRKMRRVILNLCVSLFLALGLLAVALALVSASTTAAPNTITPIYDIQYTTDPSGDSPLAGQIVTTTGIVHAVYPGYGFCIADAPGPWHSIYVYYPSGAVPQVGDEVRVQGTVQEYYGLTELADYATYTSTSSGNTVHAPSVVTATQIQYNSSASEPYESVFVEVRDIKVTAVADDHGIWTFTDASGGSSKADDWAYHLEPNVGDQYSVLRGALIYDWDEFKVMPRSANDIILSAYVGVQKDASTRVSPGTLFTYTITVENALGFTLNDVVITDAVPANTTFAYALDGGGESGGVVSWTVSSLPDTGSTIARFAVTATSSITTVINADYAVVASNYTTPTAGAPIVTFVDTELAIHRIQGASHVSPLVDREVEGVRGIVTAKRYDGFYMQDPNPDGDIATSEAIFVHTGGAPPVNVGDGVSVTGTILEYGSGSGLSVTRIGNSPNVTIQSNGNVLPTATIIGTSGRIPPDVVIDDDTMAEFDPTIDGIDFYESLEGMLVQINDAVAVGPTWSGQIPVVGDGGANATFLSPRGGIVIQQNDYNPERIIIDDTIVSAEPTVNTGASFAGPITGVIDYSSSNFKLLNTAPLPAAAGGVISETTTAPTAIQLRVASFNVYNLDPGDSAARFAGLAGQIANNLKSPDIIALEEIQDNSGPTDDGTVDANVTYNTLIAAIRAAGGPIYEFRDISPQDGKDGGQSGGNIRVGFLFRPDRVSFIDRPGGDATTAVAVTMGATGPELSVSPGRIEPTNQAFTDGRKSLAGEFSFNGRKLFVVANHFKSKLGDDPLFGRNQPPAFPTEVQRKQQAQVVNTFVDDILALDPNANVIVLGDMNDFQFSESISDTLAADALTNLMHTLPITEQYTYVYEGNAQVLDHILVSENLYENSLVDFDVVHVNAEFASSSLRPSDHDPVVATFQFLSVEKEVAPTTGVSPGSFVTYTVTLANNGTGVATGLVMTDTLPPEIDFGGWVYAGSALPPGPNDREIVWGPWTVESGETIEYIFTATLKTGSLYFGIPVTNTVEFVSTNAGSGRYEATFNSASHVYLPLVTRSFY